MKNIYIIFMIIVVTLIVSSTYSQNVGINTDGSNPDPSAMLDIVSSSKGLLIPRMTTAQRTTDISSPATGLIVYDTTTKSLFYYNGTAWAEIKESKGIEDDEDDTKVYVTSSSDSIYFMVNGVVKMTIDPTGIVNVGGATGSADLRISSGTGQESSISLNSGTSGLRISTTDLGIQDGELNIDNISATDNTDLRINSGTGQESSISLNSGTSGLRISTSDTQPDTLLISNTDGTIDTRMLLNSGTGQESSISLRSGSTESYSITADGTNFAVAVNGTDKLVVEPAGNVGIGIANPDGTYALDVGGAIHSSGVIRSGNSIIIDGVLYEITTDDRIAFKVNSTEYMRLVSTGEIGIGTATPSSSSALDITSTTKGILIPRMTTVQRTSIASPALGLLVFDTDVNGFFYHNGTVWTNITTSNPPAGANNSVQFNNGGAFGGNNNFIWDNTNGSLGIGTATPDASSVLDITATNKGILIPRMNKSIREGIGTPAIGLLVYQLDDVNGFWFYDGTWKSVTTKPFGNNNEIQFNNSGSFGSNNNFVWDNTNSRLGIGLVNPTYTLDVAGSAKVNSLNINSVYNLPTIDGNIGQVMQTDGTGTLTWSVVNAKQLDGTNLNAPSPTNGQVLSYNSTMSQWESLTLSADYTGSGTSNNLTKWTGGNSFGNSIIQDDGTNLGFGIAPNAGYKVNILSSSTAKGLFVSQTGTSGDAGYFSITGATNASNAVSANTNGTGQAGSFIISNGSSTAAAIYGATSGTGPALSLMKTSTGNLSNFVINNATNASDAIYVQSNGVGKGINVLNTGNGIAGYFTNNNSSNSANTVNAYSDGAAGSAAIYGRHSNPSAASVYGVYGTSLSTSGVGVYGTSNMTGIEGSVSGTVTSYAGRFSNTSSSASPTYGVYSLVNGTSTSSKYGFWGFVASSGVTNYGTYSEAFGATTNYGVYAKSVGAGTTNYGLYSTASGASNNIAAFFDQGNVGIGTNAPAEKLDLNGNLRISSATGEINRTTNGADKTGTANLLPIGYGVADRTGAAFTKTSNITITRTGLGTYNVAFSDYNNFLSVIPVAMVSIFDDAGGNSRGIIQWSVLNGTTLLISTFDIAGTSADRGFSIYVYTP